MWADYGEMTVMGYAFVSIRVGRGFTPAAPYNSMTAISDNTHIPTNDIQNDMLFACNGGRQSEAGMLHALRVLCSHLREADKNNVGERTPPTSL